MKAFSKQLLLYAFLCYAQFSAAQNVGIGVAGPQQKLEVNGAVKIGSNDAVAPVKGTMRWNNGTNQFEGFDGIQWVRFGSVSAFGNSAGIGDTAHYSYESDIYDPKLLTTYSAEYPFFGGNLVAWKNYFISGAPYYFARENADGYNIARTGKVGLFERNASGKYVHYAFVASPSPDEDNEFGMSIAADEQRFIIGEPKATGTIYQQGKVHIYSNANAVEKTLVASDPVSMDNFGEAVGIAGNFAAVGTSKKTDVSNVRRGKLYIFKRNTTDGQWVQHQAFVGSVAGMEYGKSIAMTGSFIAAGAPSMTQNGFAGHGGVYLYNYNSSTGNWAFHSMIKPADNGQHKGFGAKLLLRGDTLLVAEYPQQAGMINRLFMFVRTNNVWTQVKEFTLPGSAPGDGSMSAFDIKGNRILIGQSAANVGGISGNGKLHLFEWVGNDWVHRTILRPSDPSRSKRFGQSVLFAPNDILCGAPNADGEYEHSGIIYIFRTLW